VLTAKLPFSARTPMEYIQKHVMEPIIPLGQRVPELKFPKGLEQVLEKALAKRPEDRYQSAAAFAEALRPLGGALAQTVASVRVTGQSAVPRDPLASEPPPARGPGAGLLVGVAAFCLVVGVVLAVVVMRVLGP
jgi:hypothetical protein